MLNKVLLYVTGVSFVGYGLLCFFIPELPARYIGYSLTNADSYIEMAAMYGGLQTGMGLFCLLGAIKTEYTKASLLFIIFTLGGLAVARSFSFAFNDDPLTFYTYGAIFFEIMTTFVAAVAFFKSKS